MPEVVELLAVVDRSWLYHAMLVFFATYPVATSIMWITTSLIYRLRWEPVDGGTPALVWTPRVTVLIPAHNEEKVLDSSLRAVCAIDYPDFETVVVDDGSTDDTRRVVEPYVAQGKVRLIAKNQNEGKAMALNDALPCVNGEILLMLDADADPEPDILRRVVPHFASARVAAVTGNPRVKNVDNVLTRLQFIEFTSIVSLLRRSQRVWGRIVTVSGVVAAFRRAALIDVGGFSPDMPTEDIELTWKLQKRFWDVRYEPRALVWMTVPATLKGWMQQRLRWARGLMQVLRRHRDVVVTWKYRRMWPIYLEGSLSVLWALCFVVLTALWLTAFALGYPLLGAQPVPAAWGLAVATLCLLQLLTGTVLDRDYDPDTSRFYVYAVFYPILYWVMVALATFLSLPYLFRRPPRRPVRWASERAAPRE
jgi:biofilm PGA synthesis N-glycosyltransferase PgaC